MAGAAHRAGDPAHPDKSGGLIFHSDRGSQYASGEFRAVLAEYGITSSMSRKGNCWDNACSETLFGSLKVERLHGQRFETRRQAMDEVIAWRLQSHVEQLGLVGCQAGLDVSQRLPPCELGEGHDAKQIGAAERANARIALVSLDDPPEGLPRHKLHDLCEQRLAHVHALPRDVQTRKHRKSATPDSNHGHP